MYSHQMMKFHNISATEIEKMIIIGLDFFAHLSNNAEVNSGKYQNQTMNELQSDFDFWEHTPILI